MYDVGSVAPWGTGEPVNLRHLVHWHVAFCELLQ
jgi:hypothetical protein